jgi:1-acyl-sn-glycerol-3-phosphate acyltransferase
LLTVTPICLAVAIVLALVVGIFSTRYRVLGLAPIAATTLFIGSLLIALTEEVHWWGASAVFAGFVLGSAAVLRPQFTPPLTKPWPEWVEQAHRFQKRYTGVFGVLLLIPNLLVIVIGFFRSQGGVLSAELASMARWYAVILSAILSVWCWLRFTRPFVELCLEPIARMLYRIKAKGTKQFPTFGPCLVIANHAFWFDPCVLGVILPRPITPIMTQRFYEQWFLKPLLRYVFRVIVVPETPIKRTTPELEQAVAALDRGEVVVIFPEGYLRRKEEVPLRRFGQGVWRILSARPDTPVVACWIEGGWGSKFSYKDGPPTKNKRMDFRRKIDVAASAPEAVPAEVLADQMATRIHLMNRVAAMRAELGLAPLPLFQVVQAAEHQDEPA